MQPLPPIGSLPWSRPAVCTGILSQDAPIAALVSLPLILDPIDVALGASNVRSELASNITGKRRTECAAPWGGKQGRRGTVLDQQRQPRGTPHQQRHQQYQRWVDGKEQGGNRDKDGIQGGRERAA